MIRLGLIGDNIKQSQSPALHRLAGGLTGLPVSYELLIPAEQGRDFEALLSWAEAEGFQGLNITYPYKERVVTKLDVPEAAVRALGACNTVIFGEGTPRGHNTDYSGFRAAFAARFGDETPGRVAMAGAGGVGKAVAFGLADLGAAELGIFDTDVARAQALAAALSRYKPQMDVRVATSIADACEGTDGLVNSTPLGMGGIGGTAFATDLLAGRKWAFDAVYTPVDTPFLTDAAQAGIAVLTGYELFFHQGVDAFRLFTGAEVDPQALRVALQGQAAA
ncbi:shikimate dehydrogenase [Ketogulonicigenium robustum]|uniref:Shikimate dehydrogenase n=1 Tax=Ketogulonicigenium robustum TaxID=92947 RepID=A0A1W6NX68_9RHOB|nr:shikimate dehydrogenase [Ketogulonicigenium robustum]ARO13846.1 shikimate dehydrogenase [Ketogulonicigenium robustum]